MVVATASVGLTMAPSAMPVASPIPGTSHDEEQTRAATELSTTSTTDSPPMARKSRRKSIVGIETAAE